MYKLKCSVCVCYVEIRCRLLITISSFYLQHVLDVFGVDRYMFGSDWPVLSLANATYRRVVEVAENLTDHLSREDKKKIFRENAIRFYKLRIH